ncbi:MAG: SapC family protein [Litorimonas sp.]
MSQHVQLSPERHRGLRVRRERSAALGDGAMYAPVFPQEMRQVQAHYPIVFARDPQMDGFRPVALFGLEKNSNLFLDGTGWDAPYVPVAARIAPFLIGRAPDGPKVHIDLAHPRVSETEGDALFGADGKPTDLLNEASGLLGLINDAEGALPRISALLTELGLLEPFTLNVTLASGRKGRLEGFHTLNEDRLQGLNGEELGRLQSAQVLMPLFMAVASVGRFEDLIRRQNVLDTADGTRAS